ncbi:MULTISPECIES: MarR family winged helix-turn-helix transcriptional regulator [Streptomyces violaceusniger group]|uniref:HTH marR-type domain-containing protein n=1 Tax=Streptomyces rhizosphaericus TaxID=114699 RepID=A0ABN1SFC3_9ACTN|nr:MULTISPECIES: MarR family transcriptional regulator [Streptomyces violaceusniger group]
MPDRRLERLERELMLVARCSVLTPRERKGQATDAQATQTPQAQAPKTPQAQAPTTQPDTGTTPGVESCTPTRLDRSGYLLLSRLDAEGAMTIGQLADAFQLDVSTVNRQTGALLRSGLVERIPDPEGGLARKLRVTPRGADRMAAERTCRQTDLSRLLESWTPEDVARFEDVLTRFNREVERQEGRAWPRETDEAARSPE